MLYNQYGEALEPSSSRPDNNGLRSGWKLADEGQSTPALANLSRQDERRRARVMYYVNPLLGGAADICAALLVGDELTYGEVSDPTARLALEEFFNINSLGTLIPERWIAEYLTDGEQCTVFPQDEAGRDAPAVIGFLDVDGVLELKTSTARGANASDMVERVTLTTSSTKQIWQDGQFTWTADRAMFNDARGWPILGRACDAALSYIALLNHRINIHELQARILGIYKAFVSTTGADGGLAQHQAKAGMFSQLPRRGGVMTVAMDPKTGVSESLEFLRAGGGSGDAETDARALLRLVGMTLGGLPEHWLGEGGNANKSTAGEMSAPALAIGRKRQNAIKGYLDRLMRLELLRRYGPERLYTVKRVEVSDDGLTRKVKRSRVPASNLYFPWNLPTLTQASLQEQISRADLASRLNLASPQTLSASLGFDASEESERMAAAGLTFGGARGSQPPGGSNDPTSTQ